jgi:hypothetical protein
MVPQTVEMRQLYDIGPEDFAYKAFFAWLIKAISRG